MISYQSDDESSNTSHTASLQHIQQNHYQKQQKNQSININNHNIQTSNKSNLNTSFSNINQLSYILTDQKQNKQHIQFKQLNSNQQIQQITKFLESKKQPKQKQQIKNKDGQKLQLIEQKLKSKNQIKRFNLQQTPKLLQKPTSKQPLSNTKIKPKLGTGQMPPLSSILFTTWNINGIRFSVSKNHLSYYINQTQPDILCLTQTKMDQYSYLKQPIHMFGFNGYWNFCKCSLGYSGVVIFSKYQPIRVIEGIPQKIDFQNNNDDSLDFQQDFDKEGRIITLEFKDFFLVLAYIPTAGKQLQRLQYKIKQFEPRFFGFCQKLMKIKPTIVSGDFNTALTELDTHMTKNTTKRPAFTSAQRQSLQGFIDKNKLIDTYRYKNPKKQQFTWWHIKYFGRQYLIGKRLDYFLVSQQFKPAIISAQIKQKFKGSDHSPMELRLDLRKILKKLT